jgi:hypothetical protein
MLSKALRWAFAKVTIQLQFIILISLKDPEKFRAWVNYRLNSVKVNNLFKINSQNVDLGRIVAKMQL